MDWKNRGKCCRVRWRSRYVYVAVQWFGNLGKDGRSDQGWACAGGAEEGGCDILCTELDSDGNCIRHRLRYSVCCVCGRDDRLFSAEQRTGHTGCKAVSDDNLRSGHIFFYESDIHRDSDSDGKQQNLLYRNRYWACFEYRAGSSVYFRFRCNSSDGCCGGCNCDSTCTAGGYAVVSVYHTTGYGLVL